MQQAMCRHNAFHHFVCNVFQDKLRKMKRSIGIIVDDIGIDDVDVDVDILDDEEFSMSMRKIAEKRCACLNCFGFYL